MNEPIDRHTQDVTSLDQRLAIPMFVISLCSLLLLGAFFHLTGGDVTSRLSVGLLVGIAGTYVAMFAETALHIRAGSRQMRQHLYYCLLPMARLCPHDHLSGERAWVPFLGWRKRTDYLEHRLARMFGGPMILIALLVLPVVGIEFLYPEQLEAYFWFNFAWRVRRSTIKIRTFRISKAGSDSGCG